MSGLRDARLRKALEAAPDADAAPPPAVRRAILAAAHGAVAPAPWWHAVWHSMGSRRGPWNAALATVLLAGFITVLWHDREAPGARPDALTAVPAPAAPASSPVPAPVTPDAAVADARKSEPPVRKPAPSAPPAAASVPAPAAVEPPAPALRDREAAPSKAAAQQQERRADAGPPPAAAPPAPAAAPPAPVAAPAAAPAPAAPPAAFARGRAAREEAAAPPWTDLRLLADGRSIELERAQAGRPATLVDDAIRAAQGDEPLAAPVTARVEVRRAGELLGVLELAGPQVRWLGRTGRPPTATLQALTLEIERLLPPR